MPVAKTEDIDQCDYGLPWEQYNVAAWCQCTYGPNAKEKACKCPTTLLTDLMWRVQDYN